MKEESIIWVKTGNLLCATVPDIHDSWVNFLNEETLLPIQEWSDDNKCGLRISFDMFRFKTDAEMTIFLLRWS